MKKRKIPGILAAALLVCLCLLAGCGKEEESLNLTLRGDVSARIDLSEASGTFLELPTLFEEAAEGVRYEAGTDTEHLKLSLDAGKGTLNITSDGTTGEYTVHVTASKEGKKLLTFDIAVNVVDLVPDPAVTKEIPALSASLPTSGPDDAATYECALDLSEYFSNIEGAAFEMESTDKSAKMECDPAKPWLVRLSFQGAGERAVTIYAVRDGTRRAESSFRVTLSRESPASQTKEIPDLSGSIPIFLDQRGAAVCEHTLDLSEYFPNVEGAAFEMECADKSAKMESDPVEPWRVKLSFREPGERIVTIRATRGGERVAEASFRVTLTAETPRQLFNGDFESGLAGWDLDADGLAAYAVIDDPVDIWNNNIFAEGAYLYGYHDENGTCEFTSSLFELDGTGYITWKMAGNCTENLQFILMQYNEDGEDVEIAKFNNWYYGEHGLSGFIFRDYYYQVDMDRYGGSKCYFIVRDNATRTEPDGFAFVNLDSIVTYHEQAPDLSGMYPAGYRNAPEGQRPETVVQKEIQALSAGVPLFPGMGNATYYEYTLDLSQYFSHAEGVTFEMKCSDNSASMECDPARPWLVKLSFRETGEKTVTIYAVRDRKRCAETSFRVTLTGEIPKQLFNGDFENGLTGWDLDEKGLAAYAVIDSPTDIWGNGIDAEGAYLYGYHDEKGTCEFTSSLFELGGTGYITWKMAGNCTDNLQFILMQYNEDGEDAEIARFNNWYYGAHGLSGFIFRNYYYQVDMELYGGSTCYFIVRDNDTGADGFGFLNLDSIVTYHTEEPMYQAGYKKDPAGLKKEIPAVFASAPLFPGQEGATYYECALDLSEYFSSVEGAAFEMACTEESAAMRSDPDKPWLVKLSFREIGEKTVTIYTVKDGVRRAESTFQVTLTAAEIPKQLFNGDFENGLAGWGIDEKGLAAYAVIDSPTDIWGNEVHAEGAYLYGYYNEDGTCEFTSSLFELDGTGYITWKMAGNCTENLQFILMQHNEDGEDVEIARFNNWYYGAHGLSGFIFRDYYYQVDMDSYGGSKCYFIIRDNATRTEPGGFAFVNLDSIVTYHEQAPDLSDMYLAGYLTDPNKPKPSESGPIVTPVPNPVLTKEIPAIFADAPLFPSQESATYYECALDLSQYFTNLEGTSFEMTCTEEDASMECDAARPWLVKLSFREIGEKTITIYAVRGGTRRAEGTFQVTLKAETPRQLFNGDFESGLAGWNLDEKGRAAYAVIDDPVDIWNNNIFAEGAYLYGYHDENGTCEFTSSLFELDGTGYITWKMAGNCTENLQFILMQYNDDGEDVEIAKFNNWYYGEHGLSGFIFRDYYYQVDMDSYGGSKCYFIVRDNATRTEPGGFAFVNLDSIVTYHEQAPDLSGMYPAGYLTDPNLLRPDPAVTKEIPALSAGVPVFPGKEGLTAYEYALDLSAYFSNVEAATFEMECTDESAKMECDPDKPWLVRLSFQETGEKIVTIYAVKDGMRRAETSFQVTLTGEVPKQLLNGDFENGLTGWDLDDKSLAAYTVFDSPVDIWDNDIGAEGAYLYGYYNEDGTCEFTSSLFEMDGTGYITWKMAGNCTENLQFILMQYNEDGEDVEIARFNNWYYGAHGQSGFIFRDYYYQVDMDSYGGSKCYFIVRDNATKSEPKGFGFLNLDSIVTYYPQKPNLPDLYCAGYIHVPEGQTKEIPDLSGSIPVFPDQRGAAVCEHTLDLSEYFPNVEGVAFEMECADKSAKMESNPVEPWRVKLSFREPGERIVTIRATRGGERVAEASFRVTLTAETPRQLFNGDFESGLAGWDLDADGLAAYAVIDSPVDIWGNGIDAEGSYLYGYHNESGTCEFTSSLFELDGTGYITWKMAGNCTENLQFILMQYNEDGEDTEIAKFNNWYFGVYGLSGFIFRDYYYQVDMDNYGGSKCYFIVRDNATDGGFAFMNLDSIITYHEQAPDLSDMYPAGYLTDPR